MNAIWKLNSVTTRLLARHGWHRNWSNQHSNSAKNLWKSYRNCQTTNVHRSIINRFKDALDTTPMFVVTFQNAESVTSHVFIMYTENLYKGEGGEGILKFLNFVWRTKWMPPYRLLRTELLKRLILLPDISRNSLNWRSYPVPTLATKAVSKGFFMVHHPTGVT